MRWNDRRLILMTLVLIMMVLSFYLGTLYSFQSVPAIGTKSLLNGSRCIERISPKIRINLSEVHLYKNKIVIDVNNPSYATFTDTNSMDPVLDAGMIGLKITPKSSKDIYIGDIITFKKGDSLICHRVVELGEDEKGWFARTKGDNTYPDHGKLRWDSIKSVYIGVIY